MDTTADEKFDRLFLSCFGKLINYSVNQLITLACRSEITSIRSGHLHCNRVMAFRNEHRLPKPNPPDIFALFSLQLLWLC